MQERNEHMPPCLLTQRHSSKALLMPYSASDWPELPGRAHEDEKSRE